MNYTRYQARQNQGHMQSHANEESYQQDGKWEHRGHEDAADRYGSGRVHIKGAGHNVESGTAEHSQLNAHGANINRAQIRYEANEIFLNHRTDETASNDLWSAGSDPKYQHAARDTGATILKDRKSITEKPGGNEYKSIEAQRKAHLDQISGSVAHRQASSVSDQVPWPIMGRAMIIMFPRNRLCTCRWAGASIYGEQWGRLYAF